MVLCTVHRISPNTEPPPGPKNPQPFMDNDKFDGASKPSGKYSGYSEALISLGTGQLGTGNWFSGSRRSQ